MSLQIGPYTLVEQIGEGGMGEVHRATQSLPVKRTVALKILKAGMATKPLIARFEAERQALAMMDHPGIAKILDAGETEQGQPYFVMDLVDGQPIDLFCETHALSREQRLQLFVRVCQAVQHAHQKGIIHRDLNPSNILVDMAENVPAPKIIDFGIAKALQGHRTLTDKTLMTQYHQVLGTPAYMSPEQLDASGYAVDTRTDIYSLGVILYELLTGTLPFQRERLEKASATELERILIEEEPPRPSKHVKDLEEDLDWIVMKAMDKDHNLRYANVDAFAADVRAYLEDAPVSATPPSRTYLMGKFVRRHRGSIAFAGTVLAVLLVGVAVSVWQAVRATRAEVAEAEKSRLATQRLATSDAMLEFITEDMLGQAMPSMSDGRDMPLSEAVHFASRQVDEKFAKQPRVRCFMHLKLGKIYEKLGRIDRANAHVDQAEALLETSSWMDSQELAEIEADIADQRGWNAYVRAEAEESYRYFEIAWKRRVVCLGELDLKTLETRLSMADAIALMSGREEEAIAIMTEVEEQWEGRSDVAVRQRINLLATKPLLYHRTGQMEEARQCLARAESLLDELDEDIPYTELVTVWHNLGTAHISLNDGKSALPYFEKSLAGVRQLYDRRHTNTARTLNLLGRAYLLQDRPEDALAPLKEGWEIYREISGPGNEWTLIYLRQLVMCLQMLDHEEHGHYLERLLRDAHEGMGDGSYMTAWAIEQYQQLWQDRPDKLAEMTMILTGEAPWPEQQSHVLVAKGSPWHFHTGSDPGLRWATADFEAATWARGAAPLGYGESDIATEIPSGPDPDAKWAASYFRHHFPLNPNIRLKKLRVKVRRDDGVLVFLNGHEIARHHLPEAPGWQTYATAEVGQIEETLYYTIEIDPTLLQPDNVIAAQVHQCNGGSSDVFFDLELEGLLAE